MSDVDLYLTQNQLTLRAGSVELHATKFPDLSRSWVNVFLGQEWIFSRRSLCMERTKNSSDGYLVPNAVDSSPSLER